MDDTRLSPVNFFWKSIMFIVCFFQTLLGIESSTNKRNNGNVRGTSTASGSGGGGSGGGGGNNRPDNDKGPRKFGPRGFKSITDLPSPPDGGCAGGACG